MFGMQEFTEYYVDMVADSVEKELDYTNARTFYDSFQRCTIKFDTELKNKCWKVIKDRRKKALKSFLSVFN